MASGDQLDNARRQLGLLLATAFTGQLNARTAAAALNGAGCLGSQLLKEYVEVTEVPYKRASRTLGVSPTTLSLAINGKAGVSIRLALELIATILLDTPQGQQSRLLDRTEQLMQAMSTGELPNLAMAMEKIRSQAPSRTAEANLAPKPVAISDYLNAMRALTDETNTRLLILADAKMNLNATEFGRLLSNGIPDTSQAATSSSSISRKLRALAKNRWLTVDHISPTQSAARKDPPPGNQTVYRWNDLPAKDPDALPPAYADLWGHHLRQIGHRIAKELLDTLKENAGKMKEGHATFFSLAAGLLETYVKANDSPTAKDLPIAPDTDVPEATRQSRKWFNRGRARHSLAGETDLAAKKSATSEYASEEAPHRLGTGQRYLRVTATEVRTALKDETWLEQVSDAHFDQLIQAAIKSGMNPASADELVKEVFRSLSSTASDDAHFFEPGSLHAEKVLHRRMNERAAAAMGEDCRDRLRLVLKSERLRKSLEAIENEWKNDS